MKKNNWGLASLGILIAGAAWAASEIFHDQSASSIEIVREAPGLGVQTKETHYITAYLGDYSKKVLIKATTTLKTNTGAEGRQGSSEIEARSEKDFYATPLWTATDLGQEVIYQNDELLKSVNYGCCGEFTRSKLYNVENGTSPATYLDQDFFTITVPNSGLPNRYLAQIDDPTAPKTKAGLDYIGSIAYFQAQGSKAVVRFYAKVTPGWGTALSAVKVVNLAGSKSKNEVRGNELELWDGDGQKDAALAYKGFGVSGEIDFDNQHFTFEVPVNKDQIDSGKIKVTPGLTYEVL